MGICGAWGAYRPLPYVYEGGSARRFRAVGAVALCVPAAPRDAMPFNNKKSQLGDVCARAVPYNVQFQRYPQGRGDPGEVAHRLGARPPPPSADTTAFSACCEGKVWFGPLCGRCYVHPRRSAPATANTVGGRVASCADASPDPSAQCAVAGVTECRTEPPDSPVGRD